MTELINPSAAALAYLLRTGHHIAFQSFRPGHMVVRVSPCIPA